MAPELAWQDVVDVLNEESKHQPPGKMLPVLQNLLSLIRDLIEPEDLSPPDRIELISDPNLQLVMDRYMSSGQICRMVVNEHGAYCYSNGRKYPII